MAKKFTGIEITPDVLRAVELTVSGKDTTVTAMAEYRVGVLAPEELLAKLLKDKKIDNRNICTGIDAGKIFFRENSFPFKDKKKILQALPFTLADSLPFPMEDAVYDSFLPRNVEGSAVLATLVVKKDALHELENKYIGAGIKPLVIGAENAALSVALRPKDEEKQNWISLHIGKNKSIISSIKDNMPLAGRTIDGGTKDIISKLASSLGVNELEATDLLYGGNLKIEKPKMEVAGDLLSHFVDSIMRQLDILLKKTGQVLGARSVMLLTGEGALIKDLALCIEAKREIKIAASSPGCNLKISVGIDKEELSTKGAVALGYALTGASGEGINFIRGRSRIFDLPFLKLLYGERKLLAAALALLVFLYTVSLAVTVYTGNKKYSELKKTITLSFKEALPDIKRIVNEKHQLSTALSELEEKVSLISDEGSVKVVDILLTVASAVPTETLFKVNKMTIGDNEVKIDGETTNFDGVEKIKSALKKSAIFEDVEVGGAKASRLQNVIEFRLNIKLAG